MFFPFKNKSMKCQIEKNLFIFRDQEIDIV